MPSSDGDDQAAVELREAAPSGGSCSIDDADARLLPARKNCSPTMAPITDRPAEIRKPVKIDGSAAGNCSFTAGSSGTRRAA